MSSAFLAGVAVEDRLRGPDPLWLVPLFVALATLALAARPSAAWRALALALFVLAGAWASNAARRDADARIATWLPKDGTPVEFGVEGEVLGSPERDVDGQRWLRLRWGACVPAGGPGEGCTVLLRVAAGPPDAAGTVDSLRRGDRVRAWARLRFPVGFGNPGQSEPRRGWLARGVDATGSVKSARLIEIVARGRFTPARLLDRIKAGARVRLDAAYGASGATRSILGAMLLGDRIALDRSEERLLRDAGLIHILSISGLHVGLILAALVGVLRRVRLRPSLEPLSVIAILAGVGFLVGAQPPVLRSVLSASIAIVGRSVGRDGRPLNTLFLVAAALVAARPAFLSDPGFQLSFLATAGILGWSGSAAARFPLPRWAALALGVSAAAYVATVPATAWHFGRVCPVSLLTNLVSAPLCAVALATGAGALLFTGVPLLGAGLEEGGHAAVRALLGVSSLASRLPAGSMRVPAPSAAVLVVYALLVLALVCLPRSAGRLARYGRASAGLAFALLVVWVHLGPVPPSPTGLLEIAVLDVGQGQAVVLRSASGRFVVVDAGSTSGDRNDLGERVVAGFLARSGCRRVETLILSHDHDDHAGGAGAILREFEVGEVWFPSGTHRQPVMSSLLSAAAERGAALVSVARGFEARPGGIEIAILHPGFGSIAAGENERCVVARAGMPPARILIPADIEAQEEVALLLSGQDLSADAMIVGHHGSARGTSAALVRAVRPSIAVASVGRHNRFGHPDPSVLGRLRESGARIYRTDRDGMVRLVEHSTGWRVETYQVRTTSEAE